ncbi:hypothetical protein EYS14_22410 [Alteromonadaceae bacterium M269]|nr:hypothetical protein EYS14_22410 [Alteromonadaceae bacterium M269]
MLKGQKTSLSLNFSDDQICSAGVESEEQLRPLIEAILSQLPKDVQKLADNFDDFVDDSIESLTEDISEKLCEAMIKNLNNVDLEQDFFNESARAEIEQTWKKPLRLLLQLITTVDDVLINIINRKPPENNKNEALVRLLSRAIQITREVFTLLKAGFADGAQARWRSLHELSVIVSILVDNSEDTSSRYLRHEGVETYKAALLFNENATKFSTGLIPAEEFYKIKGRYDFLIKKYGKAYKKEYGWASHLTRNDNTTFRDLENLADLDVLRVRYKSASSNIHTNPSALFERRGLYRGEQALLIANSVIGLSEPGELSALSLTQIVIDILSVQPEIESITVMKTLLKYQMAVVKSFSNSEAMLKRKIRDIPTWKIKKSRNKYKKNRIKKTTI